MRPEREPDPPEQDWGSSVLRDLGMGPEPAPGADPAPGAAPSRGTDAAQGPDSSPSADPAAGADAAPAVDNPARPTPGSATLPLQGADPGAGSVVPGPEEDERRGLAPGDLDPEQFTRPRHHRDPVARQAARRVREVLGMGASREVREATTRAERLRQPVTTIRRIAVLSGRGGAGKTTLAALVATALAAARPDRVLAVDAAPELGSLALVAGAASPRPVAGFGRAAPQPQAFEDADPHLGRTDSGLWLLTGPTSADPAPRLDLPAYRAAVAALSRFFAVLVTDCGPDPASRLNLGVLEDAHALALVAPATVDGLLSAHQAIARLRQTSASLLPRTVVVLSSQSPHTEAVDLKRGTRSLASQGVRVARLPYDRHLAAGARLRPQLLGERTTTTVIGLAADLLGFAVSDRGGW
jgi:MinD-like ATPase involved in chromosome partitioning or flagellar assembly